MKRKIIENKIFYLKVSLWIMATVIFILSLYIIFSSNFNEMLNKSGWDSVSNINNILGLLGTIISIFIIFPLYLTNKIQAVIKQKVFPDPLEKNLEATYEALLFTVSQPDLPIWMIKHYKPKAIGLIGTEERLDSLKDIRDYAKQHGIKIYSRTLESADVIVRTKQETLEIIEDLTAANFKLQALDITGGKTPMSIGAFLAAEEKGIDTLYVTADYNQKGPISGSIKSVLLSRKMG